MINVLQMTHSRFNGKIRKSSCYLMLFVVLLMILAGCKSKNDDEPVVTEPEPAFRGLCYSPYRDNEDPNLGIQPTIREITEDLQLSRKLTRCIRIYGVTDSLVMIPSICNQLGIDCYPGAWISRNKCENEKEIAGVISVANQSLEHVIGIIVGNEVLLRGDATEEELIAYINRIKDSTTLPVATAETAWEWLQHPDLAAAVDIMFVHIYPYWDGQSIDNAAVYVLSLWNQLKNQYPDKKMVIGETGWPSDGNIQGNAVPSPANQKKYMQDFLSLSLAFDINYFFFEIFDENWKSKHESSTGIHWGIYNADGSLKTHLMEFIPTEAQAGISRPPRQVYPTVASLPLIIYSDGCSEDNRFFASGLFPDQVQGILINESCTTCNPHSGNSCIKISYAPTAGNFGGIYWQYPVNNWGKYPGYDLSGSVGMQDSVVLTFWARGENGTEKVIFKSGGMANAELFYRDSYGPVSNGTVTLTAEWKQYTLNLSGLNLSMIIGGFCWVTSYDLSPAGVTFYLDDIVIRKTD